MPLLRWLSRRWGQAVCFAMGGLTLTFGEGVAYSEDAAAGGAIWMFTGLGLRAIAVWRESRS